MPDDMRKLIKESIEALDKEESSGRPNKVDDIGDEGWHPKKTTENPLSFSFKRISKIVYMMVAGAIFLVIITNMSWYSQWAGKTFVEPPSAKRVYVPGEVDAWVMSQEFVSRQLKAPSTAEFESYNEAGISKVSSDEFVISSYVDAQNSFGAKIRTRYVCKVKYAGNDRWNLIDFKML